MNSLDISRRRRIILDTPFYVQNIVSYGLIVYAKDTSRWLILQRRHSAEFLLLIRGLYRASYLPLLLANITLEEARILKRCLLESSRYFESIFLEELQLPLDEKNYAWERLRESKVEILTLINRLNLQHNHLSWYWPKGRISPKSSDGLRETPFECAMREFEEEVEITLPPPCYISKDYITASNLTFSGKNIESRCWIYIIPHEIDLSQPVNNLEVVNRLWATTEECYTLVDFEPFDQVVDLIARVGS